MCMQACYLLEQVDSSLSKNQALISSGIAKPGLTRALARVSAHLALTLEINDDHVINLYSLQPVA